MVARQNNLKMTKTILKTNKLKLNKNTTVKKGQKVEIQKYITKCILSYAAKMEQFKTKQFWNFRTGKEAL